MEKQVSEGSLHKWFKGSKSKDGKGGWVNVVTGGTCASDEPGEGTPKCVSSAKRASMTKAERLSAARRKKKADPNQQQKSGAAKPTYVSTDKPKKKKMKETYERSLTPLTEKAKKCWPGYEKKGTKKMFGKTYNNCVKKEEVELEAYSANPAQQAAIAIAKKKKKEEDMVAKKKKQSMYASYQPEDEMVDEGVKEIVQGAVEGGKKIITKGKKIVGTGIENLKKQFDNIDDPVKGTSKILQMNSQEPEGETISEVKDKKGKGSGTKDACYHKVKSRYSVWPSAYASGALVKCRKVGAANWGNKSEEVEVVNEVSKKTLGSYVKKAATEIGTSAMKGDYKKMQKRHKGVLDASDKLQKEGAYMGPDKKDLKQIKKMDNPDYAKKLADYEKNMDPKKRQALKDKATKGMKFTQEGMSYGLYKGSGKPGGAMKAYLDNKAKKLEAEKKKQRPEYRNNPAFGDPSHHSNAKNK